MKLMLDHSCRKELTLAEQDEDERDKAVQSQFGGVNKMYGIFRYPHPTTTHATVTTNIFTQNTHTITDSHLQSFRLYFKFILSHVGLFAVILQVKESLLALSEFKTKRTESFVGEMANMAQTTRLASSS